MKEPVDISLGPSREQLERIAKNLEFKNTEEACTQMNNLYKLFLETGDNLQ